MQRTNMTSAARLIRCYSMQREESMVNPLHDKIQAVLLPGHY